MFFEIKLSYEYKPNNMKLITIITISLFSASIMFASTTPTTEIEKNELFLFADYNVATSTLDFETKQDVDFVQIYTMNGDLIFQLPVMSNHLSIKKNLFDNGEYKLGFVVSGQAEVIMTKVTIK